MISVRRVAAALVLLSSCGGTDSGNPKAVGLVMQAIVKSNPAALTLPSGIEITSAKIVVDQVRYRPFENCDNASDESVTALSSAKMIDLLVPEELVQFDPSVQRVCRLDVRISDNHSFSEMADLSMKIQGARSDSTPFVIDIEMDREFTIRNSSTGIILSSDTIYVLGFDVNEWFTGVDLDSASVTGGTIIISEDSNEALLDVIIENVKTSASLHKDSDGDGEYDDSDEEVGDDDD